MSRARQFYVIEVQLKIQQQHARRQSVALRINFYNKFVDTIDMELQGSLRWFMMSKIVFDFKYVKTRFFSLVHPEQLNKSVTNSVYHIFMVATTSRSVLTGFAFFLCLPLITDQSLFTSRSSSLRVHNNKLHWQSLRIGKSYFGDISVAMQAIDDAKITWHWCTWLNGKGARETRWAPGFKIPLGRQFNSPHRWLVLWTSSKQVLLTFHFFDTS